MDGICSFDGESVNVNGIYSGKVYLTQGIGNGIWEGSDDNSNELNGDWNLVFDPLK